MDDEQASEVPAILKESRLRSVLKAASWRVLATLTTIAIAWLVSGDISIALEIGAWEVMAKILVYYFHERAWAMVPLGTVRRMLPAENK
ncbi:MAG: hypothetical protein CMO74_12370 [Verrucomicrobiales bacterium]|nr:hypothetical protein [Verrucomicrobiales bacterium]|tara:strand:- start:284 stop:550 length:267 start_codon:yes stop_codon:yes gene_type:complete